jgi:phage antirepressor YoqD-like protein
MEADTITVREAAVKLGIDKSSLLKRLKRNGYRIGKKRDATAKGQKVSVLKLSDFNDLLKEENSIQWNR